MIGKMYRPLKVSTLLGKRDGFRFHNKYKSNFGIKLGLVEFYMDIYLHVTPETMKEVIRIELQELLIPIAVDVNLFTKVTDKESQSIVVPILVNRLRKLERPANKQMSSNIDGLEIQIPILSKDTSENDLITLTIKPIIVNNEEFLWIDAKAETQIQIVTNTSVIYING
jgi:hypothetical protein